MSTGCEHAVEYVYHYLDQELTWARRTRIRWHLRRCNDCCGAFDFEAHILLFDAGEFNVDDDGLIGFDHIAARLPAGVAVRS